MRIKALLKGMFTTARDRDDCTNLDDNSRSCRRILMKIFVGVGRPTNNKLFNFGADPDRDPDLDFFGGIFVITG